MSQVTIRPIADAYDGDWLAGLNQYAKLNDESDSTYIYQDEHDDDSNFAVTHANPGIPSGVKINSVTVYVRAKCENSEYCSSERICLRIGSTFYEQSITTTTSITNYNKTWTTNPSTSVAWSVSDVAALQAGMGAHVIATTYVRCYEVWIVIDYSPGGMSPIMW